MYIYPVVQVTGAPSAEDIEAINSPYATTMLENLVSPIPKYHLFLYLFCLSLSLSLYLSFVHSFKSLLRGLASYLFHRSLQDMYPNAPPDALDLCRKLLQFNPNRRLTCEVGAHVFILSSHAVCVAGLTRFSKHWNTSTWRSSTTRRTSPCARR
jgi:mitogen-activated protein kinase 15